MCAPRIGGEAGQGGQGVRSCDLVCHGAGWTPLSSSSGNPQFFPHLPSSCPEGRGEAFPPVSRGCSLPLVTGTGLPRASSERDDPIQDYAWMQSVSRTRSFQKSGRIQIFPSCSRHETVQIRAKQHLEQGGKRVQGYTKWCNSLVFLQSA